MKTILTLEDELEINDFYKDLFEELQYTVLTATSYTEVIRLIQKQTVDLLIVDNLLQFSHSEKDGFQTALEVKKISPKTKIIMISAHYPPELAKLHAQYGISILLPKPFKIEELVEHVKYLIPAA
ncbi:MAG: response regulator [Candidatus Omnitrophica bacterium]|nr:response regulator [Candidatus Omnitrophota bacterium]